jgi:hypothetical protein
MGLLGHDGEEKKSIDRAEPGLKLDFGPFSLEKIVNPFLFLNLFYK